MSNIKCGCRLCSCTNIPQDWHQGICRACRFGICEGQEQHKELADQVFKETKNDL